jgi:glycolate oxidase iron-sulfur subunit
MTHAIEACVHCGFCLAACPTYQELGQEMDTPRGRIVLMKQVLEGGLPWDSAQPHIDRCLGCLACEPACPSGVPYRELIAPFRALARPRFKLSARQQVRRGLAARTIPFPARFRLAARIAGFAKRHAWLLPPDFRPMLDLMPDGLPSPERWPEMTPAQGERRARVALLVGCVQQVLAPDINTATISVLALNGVEVMVPARQVCCGGLAWHSGDLHQARALARQNLKAFPEDVDAIVTNAAGCGSTLHEYHLVMRGTRDEAQANAFRKRVVDVSAFLARLGLRNAPLHSSRARRVCYQDACHLLNGQNVRHEPRALLRAIPGLDLCEINGPHLCCGSAGTYNLDQPEIAAALGRQKAEALLATGAEVAVTGNIGCLIQLRTHLAKLGSAMPVRHTMQLLRDSWSSGDKR